MSNLFKPWLVRTETENARVINSDAVMSELLEKNIQIKTVAVADEDGFTQGLMADGLEHVIKAEPEVDYVQLAQDEAQKILDDAKAKAEDILQDAESQKDTIRQNAQDEGYRSGKEQLEQELEQLRAQLENTYQEKAQALDTEYIEKREHMEKDLVDVIVEVFNKVFHIQFDNKKQILMYLIGNAILGIEGEKKFRIKVAESNVLFLEERKEEIMDRIGHDLELEIVTDTAMNGNECIIETDSGVFNCSLGVQLENLIKDIRSLCS